MVKLARASKLGNDGTETSDKQQGLQQVGAKHIGSRGVPGLIELLVVAVIIAWLGCCWRFCGKPWPQTRTLKWISTTLHKAPMRAPTEAPAARPWLCAASPLRCKPTSVELEFGIERRVPQFYGPFFITSSPGVPFENASQREFRSGVHRSLTVTQRAGDLLVLSSRLSWCLEAR
jgi:hypothetical protein